MNTGVVMKLTVSSISIACFIYLGVFSTDEIASIIRMTSYVLIRHSLVTWTMPWCPGLVKESTC